MKTCTFVILLPLALLLLPACKSKTSETLASDGPILECEDYFATVDVCIENTEGEAKRAYQTGRAQFRQQVDDAKDAAGRNNAARNCGAALQALKQNPACMKTASE